MRRRFFLIFNTTAGTSRKAVVADIAARLIAAGGSVDASLATTAAEARAEAATAARSGLYDALVVCGGDGTIRQAAAAVAGTECPLGAVMLGTGNVLAHELGLPRKPPGIAGMLLHGPTSPIALGLANGEPFLLMAGVGFDGRIIGHLDQGWKQKIAKAAFVPATLKTLVTPIDCLTVDVDGQVHENIAWAIITSAGRYGGAFQISRRTSLRQPGLVAYLFTARSRLDLIRHASNLARGRLDAVSQQDSGGVIVKACEHVQVTAATPVPVQIDGDDFGTTPLHVSASGGGHVHFIVPS